MPSLLGVFGVVWVATRIFIVGIVAYYVFGITEAQIPLIISDYTDTIITLHD